MLRLLACNVGTVLTITLSVGGRVVLADGGAVEYDWLVLALGSRTATFGIPGVRELALPFCTFDDAQRVRRQGRAALCKHLVNLYGAGKEET